MTMKKRKIKLILFVIVLGFGGIFMYLKSTDFFVIDKCLDSGGHWNYDKKKCEYTNETLTN